MRQSILNISMEIHGAMMKALATLHAVEQVALEVTDF